MPFLCFAPIRTRITLSDSPVFRHPPDSLRLPLHCESAGRSAIDNAEVVDEFLQAELDAGWIAEVEGPGSNATNTPRRCLGSGPPASLSGRLVRFQCYL